jgi:hypothetical protein
MNLLDTQTRARKLKKKENSTTGRKQEKYEKKKNSSLHVTHRFLSSCSVSLSTAEENKQTKSNSICAGKEDGSKPFLIVIFW